MEKKALLVSCLAVGLSACVWATDWSSSGGNPERDGWEQGETVLSKDAIAANKIELVFKYKFDNQSVGLDAMNAPVVMERLVTYRGFKPLIFIGGSSNNVYAIDEETGTSYYETKLDLVDKFSSSPSVLCSGGMTANFAFDGDSKPQSGFGGAAPARGARGAGRGDASGPAGAGAGPGQGLARGDAGRSDVAGPGTASGVPAGRGIAPARGGEHGFGPGPGELWAVSSDGYLHAVRRQDGDAKWIPAQKFLPANSNVSGLNISENVIYAATLNNCGGNPNGLYAALFTEPKIPLPGKPITTPGKIDVVSFMTNGSGFSGTGGTTVSDDGQMVYGQLADGHGDVAGTYNDTVLGLDPKTLEVKDYFTPSGFLPPLQKGVAAPNVTPTTFEWNGKEVVAAGGRDGRIYILDAYSLGGDGHHTPLYVSDPVVGPDSHYGGSGIWGEFATWQDAKNGNTRWLYASIRGAAAMKFPSSNGSALDGAIVAFKLVDQGGKPLLSPQWISRDMMAPASPVTANGLVFALSTGLTPRVAKENGTPYTVAEEEKMAKPAVMYILDGSTGQQLLSSGNTATTFATGGIVVGNSHVLFTTQDSTLYVYGIPVKR
jgi:outer membrane protein assembly factor BamB